jgi:NADH-ubiquinone oxidoreductase chain 6
MSIVFWLLLFLAKYLCLFSLKSIILGIFLFFCRFSIRILLSIYLSSWYSLIFFLIYIGGLLVLFIYISSLKFNPIFKAPSINLGIKILAKLNILFLLYIALREITWNFKGFYWKKVDNNIYSHKLFRDREMLFLINIGFLLLIVLWVITKLSFRNRGALRPFFFCAIQSKRGFSR